MLVGIVHWWPTPTKVGRALEHQAARNIGGGKDESCHVITWVGPTTPPRLRSLSVDSTAPHPSLSLSGAPCSVLPHGHSPAANASHCTHLLATLTPSLHPKRPIHSHRPIASITTAAAAPVLIATRLIVGIRFGFGCGD